MNDAKLLTALEVVRKVEYVSKDRNAERIVGIITAMEPPKVGVGVW